jgi:transcriptional regulator with XRE-family HTH domain
MTWGQVVAANVRAQRAKRQWLQTELAEKLNKSQRAVSDLERGRLGDVGIGDLTQLCRVFQVPLTELLDGASAEDLAALGL